MGKAKNMETAKQFAVAKAERAYEKATGEKVPQLFPSQSSERAKELLAKLETSLKDVEKRYFGSGDLLCELLDCNVANYGSIKKIQPRLKGWSTSFLSKLQTVSRNIPEGATRDEIIKLGANWNHCYEACRLRKKTKPDETVAATVQRIMENKVTKAEKNPPRPLIEQLGVVHHRVHGDHILIAVEPDPETGKLRGICWVKNHQLSGMREILLAAAAEAIDRELKKEPERLKAEPDKIWLSKIATGTIGSESKTTGYSGPQEQSRSWIEAAIQSSVMGKLAELRRNLLTDAPTS